LCRLIGPPLQRGIHLKRDASKLLLGRFRPGFDPFHRVGECFRCHRTIIAHDPGCRIFFFRAAPPTVYTSIMLARTPRPIPDHPDVIIVSQQRAWSGRFAVDLIRFRHRCFDGTMSDPRTWELWRRGRAVALIPYDPITDSVVMIEQFRLPALAAGIEPVMIELPAGLIEDGEPVEAAMHRELQEEMRMTADCLQRIGGYLLSAGSSDELLDLYVGRVRAPESGPDGIVGLAGAAIEGEDIRIRVWPADKAIALALEGRLANSVTTLGLLWLSAKRDILRQQWSNS
jgi:ADP-ribose pyrophosphatase